MITLARLPLHEILPHIGKGKSKLVIDGHKVRTNSNRLECLKRNQVCVACGLVGNIFFVQQHRAGISKNHTAKCFIQDCEWCCLRRHKIIEVVLSQAPHLNLYHEGKRGGLVLMTQDHIFPKSRGGKDSLDNLQTMCTICNMRKGDSINAFCQSPDNNAADAYSYQQ